MKSRKVAAILAILFGGFGIHKFYMGKAIGIVYVLFCWTYIPAIIAFIEGILYLNTSDEEFQTKYIGNAVHHHGKEPLKSVSSDNKETNSSMRKKL